MWSIIKSASDIAPKSPGLLIAALQVVKRQDYCDVQYGPTAIPDIGPMRIRLHTAHVTLKLEALNCRNYAMN